ncbi:MAG TPA: ATP-binding protein, partial [Bacteroidia bacterium]|nr:ATP-binding protein [Bacteroidia bacterium]
EARSVVISACESEKELFLEITDDGKGINDEYLRERKTLGILGMKERASLLGGELVISGAVNKGTNIKLTLPLRDENINS